MSFLTAGWRKLAFVNYEIDPAILDAYLPVGTEHDLWEGRSYVSLIGFMFVDVRLRGIRIPFHINFEEVNLRFYVRRKEGDTWKRGVVFIKEIVPKPAIALVARLLYKEKYETRAMDHSWEQAQDELRVRYRWKTRNGWNHVAMEAAKVPKAIVEGSKTEFITEHYWGYARRDAQRTNAYQVTHPRWEVYDVKHFDVKLDFSENYGSQFAFLNHATPASAMLAEGSPITIEPKKVIRG